MDYLSSTEGKDLDSITPVEELRSLEQEAARLAKTISDFLNDSSNSTTANHYQEMIATFCQNLSVRTSHVLGIGAGSFSTKSEVSLCNALLGRPMEIVLDIGANKGDFTRQVLAANPSAEIHLFEPGAANITGLRALFDRHEKITINQIAVSDTVGESILYYDRPGSGLASTYNRALNHTHVRFTQNENIKTTTLNEYWNNVLSRKSIDVIKMDIEGAELLALQSADSCLHATRIVQFEFGGASIDAKTYVRDFWNLFQNAGFELYRQTMFGGSKIKAYHEREERFETMNIMAKNMRQF